MLYLTLLGLGVISNFVMLWKNYIGACFAIIRMYVIIDNQIGRQDREVLFVSELKVVGRSTCHNHEHEPPVFVRTEVTRFFTCR